MLIGILLVAVIIVIVIGVLNNGDDEDAVMEKFCKLECICCQKRP